MKTFKRVALPVLLALSVSGTAAFAQAPKDREHRGPSPEMMGRFEDGRIAMAKATLKLNDEQLKLWAPVEDMIRKTHEERAKKWAERREARKAEDGKRSDMPLPERLEKRSEDMVQQAERTKALANVLKPLFATFSDEQKSVAGPVFAQLIGGPGKGHGMHGGHRGGHGGPMMHHRGMMQPGGDGPAEGGQKG